MWQQGKGVGSLDRIIGQQKPVHSRSTTTRKKYNGNQIQAIMFVCDFVSGPFAHALHPPPPPLPIYSQANPAEGCLGQ